MGANKPINGILSKAYFKDSLHLGYNGLALPSLQSFPLIRETGQADWQQVGRYYFTPEGFDAAVKAIRSFQESELTVIDEIGPLELDRRGYWPVFEILLKNKQPVLVVIREPLVASFLERIQVEAEIFKMGSTDLRKKMTDRLMSIT